MKCVNPLCENQVHEGRGYLAICHPTDDNGRNLRFWICTPCMKRLSEQGIEKGPLTLFFQAEPGAALATVRARRAGRNMYCWVYAPLCGGEFVAGTDGRVNVYSSVEDAAKSDPGHLVAGLTPEGFLDQKSLMRFVR